MPWKDSAPTLARCALSVAALFLIGNTCHAAGPDYAREKRPVSDTLDDAKGLITRGFEEKIFVESLFPAHAYENNCFVAYCNRSGAERVGTGTWQYRGNSIICGPHGDTLLAARNEDTLLVADVIPADYGPTHPEGDYLKNRRPELYHKLVSMKAGFDGGYTYQDPPRRKEDQ